MNYFVVLLCLVPAYLCGAFVPPTGSNLLQAERKRLDKKEYRKLKKALKESAEKNKEVQVKPEKLFNHLSLSDIKSLLKTSYKSGGDKVLIKESKIPSKQMMQLLEEQYSLDDLDQKKMTYRFLHVSIRDALAVIKKRAGIQLVVDEEVAGQIQDIDITNCSVGAGLCILLSNNNPRLALVKQHDVFRVMTEKNALKLLTHAAKDRQKEQYAHDVYTVRYAKWDDAFKKRCEALWKGITASDEQVKECYLMCDDTTKKLFFKGLHNHVMVFTKNLQELDTLVPQVRVDVRVIVANKTFNESFGMEWSGVYDRRASVKHFDFVGLGPITDESVASHEFFEKLITWAVNILPPGVTSSPVVNIPIVFGNNDLSTKRLNLLLNASENRNEIRTILKPSLFVSSDELAEILVGEELPQETRLDEAIEGKLTNVTTTNYKDIGMKIKVKPTVLYDQQEVFLDIYVENSSVVPRTFHSRMHDHHGSEYQDRYAHQHRPFRGLLNYTIETARSKSRTVLKSGQTTMISGLMTQVREKETAGIPGLQDIPIFGWFFKGSRTRLVDKQLMIFITPTVI